MTALHACSNARCQKLIKLAKSAYLAQPGRPGAAQYSRDSGRLPNRDCHVRASGIRPAGIKIIF